MKSIVVTTGLTVHKNSHPILASPDLVVTAGERVAITGKNGSGKTTLLRVLAGLETDFGGGYQLGVTARETTFVHQQPWLFRGSVLANVAYGLVAHGVPNPLRDITARDWLDRLGVAALAARRVEGLSAGETRRVALARALAIEPRLLLLDEPLADIDPPGVTLIGELLDGLPELTILVAGPSDPPEGFTRRTVRLAAPRLVPAQPAADPL